MSSISISTTTPIVARCLHRLRLQLVWLLLQRPLLQPVSFRFQDAVLSVASISVLQVTPFPQLASPRRRMLEGGLLLVSTNGCVCLPSFPSLLPRLCLNTENERASSCSNDRTTCYMHAGDGCRRATSSCPLFEINSLMTSDLMYDNDVNAEGRPSISATLTRHLHTLLTSNLHLPSA